MVADYQLHAIAAGVSAGVLVLIAETLLFLAWTKRKTLCALIFSRLRRFHAKPDQLTRKRISDREKRLCAFYGRLANEKLKRLESKK